ncbi:hypothetical protein [Streptomyces prunicolor]
MAWDEWEQLKGQAARKQSARMDLNLFPADGNARAQGLAGDQ